MLVDKLSCCEDRDAAERMEGEEIFIACEDEVGLGLDCTLEDVVIVGIAAY